MKKINSLFFLLVFTLFGLEFHPLQPEPLKLHSLQLYPKAHAQEDFSEFQADQGQGQDQNQAGELDQGVKVKMKKSFLINWKH